MSKCDHAQCVSNYCPHCGDQIVSHPLQSLLDHLKDTENRARKYFEVRKGYLTAEVLSEEDAGVIACRRETVERAELLLAKWERWRKDLSELLVKETR